MNDQICPKCGERFKYSVIDHHRYVESGLGNVYLQNVETISCGCGSSLTLLGVPSLLRIIAICFAYKPARLRGGEVRFVRHILGMRGKEFASLLSVDPAHLSRIESAEKPISPSMDKLVRARLILHLLKSHPELSKHFNLDRFLALFGEKVSRDDEGLALFVKYSGPYIGDNRTDLEFHFSRAA